MPGPHAPQTHFPDWDESAYNRLKYVETVSGAQGGHMTTTQHTGQKGEALAVDYLTARGYAIITTNWRCKSGEIDIVARQGERWVFVEVRTRGRDAEAAYASISPRKRVRMIRAAHAYLSQQRLDQIEWRIDVIVVTRPHSAVPTISHTEDALDW